MVIQKELIGINRYHAKRYTVAECLAHPYLAEMRVPAHERPAAKVFDFHFENWKVSKEVYQELIFQEVHPCHPEAAAHEPCLAPPSGGGASAMAHSPLEASGVDLDAMMDDV
jgi:hypothetical protein